MANYTVGNIPPQIVWTVVRGDSAVFKVYVTDDAKNALVLDGWTIDMEIRRNGNLIVSLQPEHLVDDAEGYFTVKLLPSESEILETEDIFDIQLYDGADTVWTVAQGVMSVIEDVTGAPGGS